MYPTSGGTSPQGRLLSGLSRKPNIGAFEKGISMRDAAALGMERAQNDQKMGTQQMQEESQQRQRDSQNKTTQLGNAAQERTRRGEMQNRRQVFDTQMGFDYAGLQKRRSLDLQQALLNSAARSF